MARRVAVYPALGLGRTVVQVVAESSTNARAFVVDEDDTVTETQTFWDRERATATCALEVRIKNGATLQPCGSTTTERIGVAWHLR